MPKRSGILGAMHVAAIWLSMLCVLLGPTGLGSSIAWAGGVEACAQDCPCDEEGSEHDEPSGPAAPDHAPERGEPADDVCPDDCPDCGCSIPMGIALPVFPCTMLSSTTSSTSSRLSGSPGAPPSGAHVGIFRPPRSPT